MRRLCLCAILALLASFIAHAQADPTAQAESEAAFQRGLTASTAGDWPAMEAAYREAVALWPDNALAINDLAWLLLTCEDESRRNPEEALPLAERAVALQPSIPPYMDTLATAYDEAGRHIDAARLEWRAVRANRESAFYGEQLRHFATGALDQDNVGALAAEAHVLLGHGRLSEADHGAAAVAETVRKAALADFDAALAVHEHTAAHAGRGNALFALERWRPAAEAFAAAIDFDDTDPELWRLQGVSLSRAGDHMGAASALVTAVTLAPGDFNSRLAAATAWKEAGQPDRVAEVVEAAVSAMPRERPVWATKWRRDLYLVLADANEQALDAARQTLGTRPDSPAARAARQAALEALVRAEATRATDHAGDTRILAHYRALHPEAAADAAPATIRAALATELLDQDPAPQFTDITTTAVPENTPGQRVALADIDGDGDPDLVVDGQRVLRNDAGRFIDVDGVRLQDGGAGGVLADYDRDGDLDLYAIHHTPHGDRLYRNDTDGGAIRFTDVTDQVGVAGGMTDDHPSEGAAWGDLNGDGYPDLYVASYELPGYPLNRATPDRLYFSDGDRGFVDASQRLEAVHDQSGRGVNMVDFDLDGDLDVYVSNYRLSPNVLWVNDGTGTLHDEARPLGIHGDPTGGAYGHTIGSAWGDLDGDGDLDLIAANLAHPQYLDFSDPSMVYLQGADGTFADVRERTGLEYEETHANPTLLDADDDGDLDLFVTSVYPNQPSFLWLNQQPANQRTSPREDGEAGPLSFSMADGTWVAGVRVFNGWGAATADIDGDGDLDLCVAADGQVRLFRNDGLPGARNRSVRLRLRGVRSDTWGAGATATLALGERTLLRQLSLGHGTTSQSEPILHFGVGQAAGPFTVEVRWPSGAVSTTQLGPGLHVIEEPAP